MEEIRSAIKEAVKKLFDADVEIELTRPDAQFGDYATNTAMKLGKQLHKNPREVAEQIADNLQRPGINKVQVAGPGFINIYLQDDQLWKLADAEPAKSLAGKKIVAEYSDPNPFKVLHAGHLYTSIVGDAIASLLEIAGGEVHRVNYGGDVGLHVGKTMWAILRKIGGVNQEELSKIPESSRSAWLAERYIEGNNAYEESSQPGKDPQIKLDITILNKMIYRIWNDNLYDKYSSGLKTILDDQELHIENEKLKEIYLTTRQWSYDYFDYFYARIGTRFERYYPESEMSKIGLETVRRHIGDVFTESDGAVVFRGEDYGLHTRVFITSDGLPTYEAKDIGLIVVKKRDYDFDRSVVITGNEQAQYMAVVLKAVEQFAPELAHATTHLTHGMVKLQGGVKMSSRLGNILRAVDVLDVAAEANKKLTGNNDEQVVLAAVKYAFLKNRIGGDTIYDPEESVSLEGNSGPYLQYAYARACSILSKAPLQDATLQKGDSSLQAGERSLLRKLGEYPEVVDQAVADLLPSHIATYLYELAQTFNSFYEHNRVIDDSRQAVRLKLVQAYADTLKKGLSLLNIGAPERM